MLRSPLPIDAFGIPAEFLRLEPFQQAPVEPSLSPHRSSPTLFSDGFDQPRCETFDAWFETLPPSALPAPRVSPSQSATSLTPPPAPKAAHTTQVIAGAARTTQTSREAAHTARTSPESATPAALQPTRRRRSPKEQANNRAAQQRYRDRRRAREDGQKARIGELEAENAHLRQAVAQGAEPLRVAQAENVQLRARVQELEAILHETRAGQL